MTHCHSIGQTEQDKLFAINDQNWNVFTAKTELPNLSLTVALERQRAAEDSGIRKDNQSGRLSKFNAEQYPGKCILKYYNEPV